jgi:hypothetical protein
MGSDEAFADAVQRAIDGKALEVEASPEAAR